MQLYYTGLQLYCVIADPKVAKQHIYTKFCKFNGFQVTSDFMGGTEGQNVAITQFAIGIHSQVTSHVVAMEKVAE